MAFDAGEIIGYLKLDRTEFIRGLEDAKAEADAAFKDGIEVKVKPELDDVAVGEVLAEEEVLRKDIPVSVEPRLGRAAAKVAAADIVSGLETSVGKGLLSNLLAQGVDKGTMAGILSGMGFNKGEITKALGSAFGGTANAGESADQIVKSLLPAPGDMNKAFARWLAQSVAIPLGPGGVSKDLVPLFGPSLGGIGEGDKLGLEALFGPALGGISQSLAMDIVPPGGELVSQIDGRLEEEGPKVEGLLSGVVSGWMAKAREKLGNDPSAQISNWLALPFDKLSSNGTGFFSKLMNPIGASMGTALLGALGLAIGGGLAATLVGAAGTAVAILPGILDLQKGYKAYQALSTGGSTAGMSASSIGLGKSLQGLIGSGKSGLGAAETQIMPQITKFIDALTKAMPLMEKFAKPAINAMTGFFNSIDKGLQSSGFKSFVGDMSKLVGPIMTEFGKVISNLTGAFGGFLKLFAPVGAGVIGPWFVKITGKFDSFMNHVKLGRGFVNGMATVFSNLGKIIGAVWPLLKKFGDGLAPIGMQFFRIIGWMAKWIGRVVKLIPPNLITAIAAVVIGLKGLSKAMNIAKFAIKGIEFFMSPEGMLVLGLAAIALALIELWKHWHKIWGWIKRIIHDVAPYVHQIIQVEIIKPYHVLLGVLKFLYKVWESVWSGIKVVMRLFSDFFKVWWKVEVVTPLNIIKNTLNFLGRVWDTVFSGIRTAVSGAWSFIKPIFHTIKTVISDIINSIHTVTGAIGKIGGIANKLTGGVVGKVFNVVGSIGSGIANIFRADGGPVAGNSPYIVGERGPELFIPQTSGTVVPNHQLGGSTIVFNINAQGHSNESSVGAAVKAAISSSLPALHAALARGAA